MTNKNFPLWRSMMFVPANQPRFVDKAHQRGADAIILDLEDSIAPGEKTVARQALEAAVPKVGRDGTDVIVRINRPWRLAVRDIEAAVMAGVRALMLPKVESAEHIRAIAEVVDEVEREKAMPPGHTGFIGLVETADAYFQMREIAAAHPRMLGISIGSEDFSMEMIMPPLGDGLSHAVRESAIAARAAGIMPMGFIGTLADFADLEGLRLMCEQARLLGFEGASCIHPKQVEILNRAYGPKPAEIEQAERVIAVFEEAMAKGSGAVQLDGKMIDAPVVERSKRILAKAAVIAKRLADA